MVATEQFGDNTQIKMGRNLDGQVLYWVAAYLADEQFASKNLIRSLLKNKQF